MRRTVLLPLAVLGLALGGIIALPETASAETKRETMTRNDFEEECRAAGGTPSRDTNSEGQRVWNCGFKGGDKWGACIVNQEGMGECDKKGYGGGKPVGLAVSDDPSRPAPRVQIPGIHLPQPSAPARPGPAPLPRPVVR
jgi:hypothetical protein